MWETWTRSVNGSTSFSKYREELLIESSGYNTLLRYLKLYGGIAQLD